MSVVAVDTRSTSVRPRVLAVADRPGWSMERKTQNLTRVLADRFEIVTCFQAEVTEADLDGADLVLIYYWLELLKMRIPATSLDRWGDRMLMGICSHFELEGDWRDPGLDTLRRLPRAVFVNNRGLERAFGPLLGKTVYYTPNGVDTAFFRPHFAVNARRTGTLRVGWAGSLTNQGADHRGFHQIIEPAVAAVPGASLHTAIREQRWRTADEMLDFYRELDVYVCASQSEGTPNPCLEAAACGVPVVTTPVGSMPEFIRDGVNGFIVERHPEAFAGRLVLLRDSPGLSARLSVGARKTVQAWDWSVLANHYAQMFRAVLGELKA